MRYNGSELESKQRAFRRRALKPKNGNQSNPPAQNAPLTQSPHGDTPQSVDAFVDYFPQMNVTVRQPVQRLDYEVVHSTGWDGEYSPDELAITSLKAKVNGDTNRNDALTNAKGWQSPRSCTYPQEIILHLVNGPARIRKIQILSHHFKIATKLDIYVGSVKEAWGAAGQARQEQSLSDTGFAEGDQSAVQRRDELEQQEEEPPIEFRRLGYVPLDSNERGNFKAREMKSIRTDIEGEFLRFVARRCHQNPLNPYNQVGLVAITIMGESLQDLLDGESPKIPIEAYADEMRRAQFLKDERLQQQALWNSRRRVDETSSFANSSTAIAHAFAALDIHNGEQVENLFNVFTRAKEAAVKVEDFYKAKILKSVIELMQKGVENMYKLDGAKRAAVEDEDFELAERIKMEIETIKAVIPSRIADEGIDLDERGEIIFMDRHSNGAVASDPHSSSLRPNVEMPAMNNLSKASTEVAQKPEMESGPINGRADTSQLAPSDPNRRGSNSSEANGVTSETNSDDQEPTTPVTPQSTAATFFTKSESGNPPTPPPEQVDENEAEALSDRDRVEFEQAICVFGERLVTKLLSKKFNLRESALAEVTKRIDISDAGKNVPSADKITLAKAVFQVMQFGLTDRRENVSMQALTLCEALMEFSIHHQLPPSATFKTIELAFPTLLSKTADMNPRIKQTSTDLIVNLSKTYQSPPHNVLPSILTSVQMSQTPKEIKAKIELIERLVQELGVSESSNGLSFEAVMEVAVASESQQW